MKGTTDDEQTIESCRVSGACPHRDRVRWLNSGHAIIVNIDGIANATTDAAGITFPSGATA